MKILRDFAFTAEIASRRRARIYTVGASP